MTCPKINDCEVESLFKTVISKTSCPDKYRILGDSLPLIRHSLCDNADYNQCPIYQKEFPNTTQGNGFRSYEEMNAFQIAKANGVLTEEEIVEVEKRRGQ